MITHTFRVTLITLPASFIMHFLNLFQKIHQPNYVLKILSLIVQKGCLIGFTYN